MAPSFILKIGSLDLSEYVRVGPQDGLDVYGQGWEEPQFNQSPGTEGQAYVSTDVRNREMLWPLYLTGASKDALSTLRQQVVREVRYGARPLRVEWRDAGATSSTFYDVGFARLDEKQNFRLNDHDYADVSLKVWTSPPWGHTATERVVATFTASLGNAVAKAPIASFAGDAPALSRLQIAGQVHIASAGAQANNVAWGMAILPYGYEPQFPAGSLVATGGNALVGDSWSLASQTMRLSGAAPFSANFPLFVLPGGGTAYEGRNRVIALVRHTAKTAGEATITLTAFNRRAFAIGPTAVLATSPGDDTATGGYFPLDLGVWDVDSTVSPTQLLRIAVDMPSYAGTQSAYLAGLLVLPEEKVVLFSGEPVTSTAAPTGPTPTYTFDGVNRRLVGNRQTTFGQVAADLSEKLIGAVPICEPRASQTIAAICLPMPANFGSLGTQNFSAELAIRERFTFTR